MKTLVRVLLTALALIGVAGQSVAQVPPTFPPNTVYGRLSIGPGPGQAIPFGVLAPNLNGIFSPGQVLGNGTASSALSVPTNLSLVIDQALGSTRGSILERGAAGWTIVPPGTSGLSWVSNGAGADPAYQALANAGLANMAANSVKCNNTGGSAAATDCTATSTLNVLKTAPWPDTSEVIGSGAAKWNPNFFSNAGTGIVHRFNRVFVGEATASSSDIGPVSVQDWVEALWPSTVGVAMFASVDTLGQLGVMGASRSSDFRTLFGGATGGAQGITGGGYNDDNATSAASATVGAAGSGYTNGAQVLTVLGGTCTLQPTINVTVAGNAVTAVVSVKNGGDCTATPGNPAATSGGGGSGATLNVTYAAGNPIALGVDAFGLRAAGNNGITLGMQTDIMNAGSVVDVTPFGGVVAGSTFAGAFTSGAFANGTANVSAAWYIGQGRGGGPKHRKGGICFDGALDATVGAGGDGVCVEMARGQSVRWLNSGGTTDGEITANASGVQFPTDQAWTAFTPSPACGTATFTVNKATRKTLGKTTFAQISLTITAIGAGCGSSIAFTLPNTPNSPAYLMGKEETIASGPTAMCQITSGSTTSTCTITGNVNYLVNNRIVVSGVYENQ